MRRALLVFGYVLQAALGLILLGVAAAAPDPPTTSTARAGLSARPAGRSPGPTHAPGPSLP